MIVVLPDGLDQGVDEIVIPGGWHVEVVMKSKNEDELTSAFDWLSDLLPGQPTA